MSEQQLSRNIFMYGEINTQSIKEVLQQLAEISDYDDIADQQIKDYERLPVKLFINSPGGELLPCIGLCEFIKFQMQTPVIGVCMGEACSAAFIILINCDYRIAVRGSSLMAHPMSGGSIGSTRDCENVLNHMKSTENYIIDAIKNLTEIPEEIIAEMYLKQIDKYFTPDEAKQYKIVDNILGEETSEEELDDDYIETEDDEPCNIEE